MSKQLTTILLSIGLAALLAVLVITSIFTIRMTAPARPAADVPESDSTQPPAAFQPGLAEENGYIFFYNEDGSRFSDGIKQLGEDVYYFLSNGAACTLFSTAGCG